MAVQARKYLASILWTRKLVLGGMCQNKNPKNCLLAISQYSTSLQQSEDCGNVSKQHGEENDPKQLVQNRYRQKCVVPNFTRQLSSVSGPSKQGFGCLTYSSVHSALFNRINTCFTAIYRQGLQSVRHKSGGKSNRPSTSSSSSSDDDSDSDSSSSDEEEELNLEELDEEDYDVPLNFRKIEIHVKSLRADAVASSALDMSRSRVDDMFLRSLVRFNGERLLKKSKRMEEGDYVDLIMDRTIDEDVIVVKRAKVIKISSKKTKTDKTVVKVRAWKQAFPIPDPLKGEWKRDM